MSLHRPLGLLRNVLRDEGTSEVLPQLSQLELGLLGFHEMCFLERMTDRPRVVAAECVPGMALGLH